MINDFKKGTATQKKDFERQIDFFKRKLIFKTQKILIIGKTKMTISEKEGLLRTFDLEQKNPGKGARKITIWINEQGHVQCGYFGENKNPWDGPVEYVEVNEYELSKSNLEQKIGEFNRWQKAESFIKLYQYCTDWVLAGN